MAENIIVGIIVSVAVFLVGRSLYRKLTARTGGCAGCGGECGLGDPRKETDGVKVECGNMLTCTGADVVQEKQEDL